MIDKILNYIFHNVNVETLKESFTKYKALIGKSTRGDSFACNFATGADKGQNKSKLGKSTSFSDLSLLKYYQIIQVINLNLRQSIFGLTPRYPCHGWYQKHSTVCSTLIPGLKKPIKLLMNFQSNFITLRHYSTQQIC